MAVAEYKHHGIGAGRGFFGASAHVGDRRDVLYSYRNIIKLEAKIAASSIVQLRQARR